MLALKLEMAALSFFSAGTGAQVGGNFINIAGSVVTSSIVNGNGGVVAISNANGNFSLGNVTTSAVLEMAEAFC